ncbi:MAG: CRTAC1 family protein [Fuerstiella sp.]|nr:CRTAC1 family protein [Fuerstiella sp.]
MLSVLGQIAQASRRTHPLLGDEKLRHLRRQVAGLRPDADPFQVVFLQSELGQEELNMDNVEVAIRHLEIALEAFQRVSHPDATVRQRFRNRLLFTVGTAYIRLGETQNCCARYSSDSCIVPIRGDGIHNNETGSRKAIECFLKVLANPTEDRVEKVRVEETARWLLNIAYMTLGEYPAHVPKQYLVPPNFFESDIDFPRFRNVYPDLSLDTNNLSGGAIVDDFDGDGSLDIVTSSYDPAAQIQYFHNNDDGTFTERTIQAGLTGIFGGLNLVQADYDNDGDTDIFVCRGAWLGDKGREPNSLLRNDAGRFTDVTFEVGLGNEAWPCKSAAWADFDNDGDLDLYVGNESDERISAPTQLFRNDGQAGFTDVSRAVGLSEKMFVMGAVWGDYNDDRYPDLFVSVSGVNRLYRNNGDETFTDVAEQADVAGPVTSFATWFWDHNNDGHLDLFVSCSNGTAGVLSINPFGLDKDLQGVAPEVRQYQKEGKLELMALYNGDGAGSFRNISRDAGLTYATLPMGANFGDLNSDGFLDFYLGTGDVPYSEIFPNVMFLNQQGQSFVNVTMAGGFGHLQKGHGVSFADIDNDGDQDVYMQMGGAYASDRFNDALYENPGFGNNWLSVHLVGTTSNRSAIGACVRVDVTVNGMERSIHRRIGSGGSFGCNPLRQFIGLGQASQIRRLEVYWPTSDQTEVFEALAPNQFIRVTEGEGTVEVL